MRAAVYYPETGIQIDEKPIPQISEHSVLVKVAAAGICGSDLHYYRDGHIGDWWIRQPHVLGHEFAGTVVELGSQVEGLTVGDRVAIEPIIPCDDCQACQAGHYNLCTQLRFTGSPHTDGAFQEYVSCRPHFCHGIPEAMTFQQAALVEPTSIAVHAVRQSKLRLGDSVAIIGAGPIGLLTLAVARASGARQTYVTDLDEARLSKAEALGARTLQANEDMQVAFASITNNQAIDVVFEAVGHHQTLETGLEIVRPGGTLVVIGVSPEAHISFNMMLAQAKEVAIIPIYLGRNAFPSAIELIASGRVNAEAIITHSFPLQEARQAMETAAKREDQAIKVMFTMEAEQ